MILCVCLNPALDRTVTLEKITLGEVNRAMSVREDPGGKGVNAARTICELGGKTVCTGFNGGPAGERMEKILEAEGVICDFIKIAGNTRTNVVLFEAENRKTTDINEKGPEVSHAEMKALLSKIEGKLGEKDVLVLSGSAPTGVPDTIYEDLIHIAAGKGASCILDATGELLKCGLRAKPSVVKPNIFEAAELLGGNLTAAEYAERLHENGVRFAVVSEGAKGAAFAFDGGARYIPAFDVVPESSVGAGDAMVGAIAFGLDTGMDTGDICVLAQASSAAAVEEPGTGPGKRERIYELFHSYH